MFSEHQGKQTLLAQGRPESAQGVQLPCCTWHVRDRLPTPVRIAKLSQATWALEPWEFARTMVAPSLMQADQRRHCLSSPRPNSTTSARTEADSSDGEFQVVLQENLNEIWCSQNGLLTAEEEKFSQFMLLADSVGDCSCVIEAALTLSSKEACENHNCLPEFMHSFQDFIHSF